MLNSVLVIEAIKIIYPDIKGGFSYWQTHPNGTPWESDIDGLVWENKEYPKPNIDQFNNAIEMMIIKNTAIEKIAEIKAT